MSHRSPNHGRKVRVSGAASHDPDGAFRVVGRLRPHFFADGDGAEQHRRLRLSQRTFGSTLVRDLSSDSISAWMMSIDGANTWRRYLPGAMSQVLAFGVSADYLTANPCDRVVKPQADPVRLAVEGVELPHRLRARDGESAFRLVLTLLDLRFLTGLLGRPSAVSAPKSAPKRITEARDGTREQKRVRCAGTLERERRDSNPRPPA